MRILQLYIKLFCLFLLFNSINWMCSANLYAQPFKKNKIQLQLIQIDSLQNQNSVSKVLNYSTSLYSLNECRQELEDIASKLKSKGYLASSIDSTSLSADSLSLRAFLFLGETYEWLNLKTVDIEPRWLVQSGYKTKLFQNSKLQWEDVERVQTKLLEKAENNGFPFAKTGLKNISFKNNEYEAELFLDRGEEVLIDTLVLYGNPRISHRYLQQYLDIKPGKKYNELALQQISSRVRELAFLEERKTPEVRFVGDQAEVNLYLKNKKASRFNLLVGVIPQTQSNSTGDRTKAVITGEGLLFMQNALGAGEEINLEFKKYPQNATELKTHIVYPYLPLVPLGADLRFSLYIRDTLYRDVNAYAGIQYLFKGNTFFKAFFETKNSTILTVDSNVIISTASLPEVLDAKRNFYGVEYHLEQLDYRNNPRRGQLLHLSAALGRKRIVKNNAILEIGEQIPDSNFPAQYDMLNETPLQWRFEFVLEKYWPLGKRGVVLNAIDGAFLSSETVGSNEMYRIGGNRQLRGFDEESILTSLYSIFTLEYRYLLSENSFMFAFVDGAFVPNDKRSVNQQLSAEGFSNKANWPVGFGAGMTFETKAGLFGLSYALGIQQAQGLDLRTGKIHLGYINYF